MVHAGRSNGRNSAARSRPLHRPLDHRRCRASPRAAGRIQRYLRSLNIWFWALVGLPTLVAGVYYFAIASDLYLSEAKFIVRSPKQVQTNTIGALLQSTGLGRAVDDTAVVQDSAPPIDLPASKWEPSTCSTGRPYARRSRDSARRGCTCAGAAHVRTLMGAVEPTFAINVRGTHHLVEGLREAGVRRARPHTRFGNGLRPIERAHPRGSSNDPGQSVPGSASSPRSLSVRGTTEDRRSSSRARSTTSAPGRIPRSPRQALPNALPTSRQAAGRLRSPSAISNPVATSPMSAIPCARVSAHRGTRDGRPRVQRLHRPSCLDSQPRWTCCWRVRAYRSRSPSIRRGTDQRTCPCSSAPPTGFRGAWMDRRHPPRTDAGRSAGVLAPRAMSRTARNLAGWSGHRRAHAFCHLAPSRAPGHESRRSRRSRTFSMWRLAWIAHALATDPRHLFDANIFHPAKGIARLLRRHAG